MASQARILVVDDDPMLLDLLVDTLSSIGYYAISASNGFEALEKLRTEKIDLVITDIKMPEMDGLGLLRKVRHRYPKIPVLFITGVASQEIVGMAKPDGLLAKPFRISHVEQLIESALRTKPAGFERSTSRILIIDDDDQSRQAMSESLAISRYLPFSAHDDQSALNEIENGKIDAVVATINPPTGSLSIIFDRLRDRRPKIPLIIVKPEAEEGNYPPLEKMPQVDGCFTKPAAAKEIISLLDQVIPNIN